MAYTLNPFSGHLDYYEKGTTSSGDNCSLWDRSGTTVSPQSADDTISGSGPIHSTSEFGDGTNYALKWNAIDESIDINFSGGTPTHKLPTNGNVEIIGELIESGVTSSGTSENTEAAVLTTTSGAVTCGYITLDATSVYHVEAKVLAKETNGTNRASFHLEGCFYKESGNAVQEGSTISISTMKSNNNWECTFDTNLDEVRIRVNSNTASNIQWYTILEYILLG